MSCGLLRAFTMPTETNFSFQLCMIRTYIPMTNVKNDVKSIEVNIPQCSNYLQWPKCDTVSKRTVWYRITNLGITESTQRESGSKVPVLNLSSKGKYIRCDFPWRTRKWGEILSNRSACCYSKTKVEVSSALIPQLLSLMDMAVHQHSSHSFH